MRRFVVEMSQTGRQRQRRGARLRACHGKGWDVFRWFCFLNHWCQEGTTGYTQTLIGRCPHRLVVPEPRRVNHNPACDVGRFRDL